MRAGMFLHPAALVVKFRKSPFCGEPVKKVTAFILFILLGLALSVPAVAHAGTNPSQRAAQKHSQKAYKKSMKQQKKTQKKAQKSQKKAMKDWKKSHRTGH
jgi:hypothetical protein